MSKIYDALQIAHQEQLDVVKELNEPPSPIPVPYLKTSEAFPVKRLYSESELLTLAQNIAARLPISEQNVIQFIGSRIGEGTSTLIREFAMATAQHSSKPVLLVEADFKQPSQNQVFSIDAKPPIDYVLKEGKPLDGVISQVDSTNLFLGTLSYKALRSLTDRSFKKSEDFWSSARKQFSLILIDSSPVSSSTDSLSLCESVDGVVLVVEAEKTRSAVVQDVRSQIRMRGGNILGLVFTKRKFYIPKFFYKFF